MSCNCCTSGSKVSVQIAMDAPAVAIAVVRAQNVQVVAQAHIPPPQPPVQLNPFFVQPAAPPLQQSHVQPPQPAQMNPPQINPQYVLQPLQAPPAQIEPVLVNFMALPNLQNSPVPPMPSQPYPPEQIEPALVKSHTPPPPQNSPAPPTALPLPPPQLAPVLINSPTAPLEEANEFGMLPLQLPAPKMKKKPESPEMGRSFLLPKRIAVARPNILKLMIKINKDNSKNSEKTITLHLKS